eukprot:scaffold347_cov380-Prasinococcus_capsulatus_cf.AAC.7
MAAALPADKSGGLRRGGARHELVLKSVVASAALYRAGGFLRGDGARRAGAEGLLAWVGGRTGASPPRVARRVARRLGGGAWSHQQQLGTNHSYAHTAACRNPTYNVRPCGVHGHLHRAATCTVAAQLHRGPAGGGVP